MLYYNRIDTTKVTDPTKSNRSNESIIFHYWIYIHSSFTFENRKALKKELNEELMLINGILEDGGIFACQTMREKK